MDGQQPRLAAQRPDRDLGRGDPAVPPGRRVAPAARAPRRAGRKGDQGVLADPAGMPVAHDVGMLGQRAKRRPVGFGAHPGDLTVGAVHRRAADRQPGSEGGIHRRQGVEGAAIQDVAAHDLDLPFDPPLGLGPVRGGEPDREAVLLGERHRLRMQPGWPGHGPHAGGSRSWPGRRQPPRAPRVRWANARRWQSENVARSCDAVKQQNGSRE